MKRDHKEYSKAYYQAHKEKAKAYYQEHKEQVKAYRQAHKEKAKAFRQAHKEKAKEYMKSWHAANKDKCIAYQKADVNSNGKSKAIIRRKSQKILKKMNLHIPGYQVHHCFGYDDPAKFIYISKELHLKIHQFLRDNNIDADSDHWMQIRDIVNSTDEFTYIKA